MDTATFLALPPSGMNPYRHPPVIRNILDRKWSEWEDYEETHAGYNSHGESKYRKILTPLGRALRKFKQEYPLGDGTTVRYSLRDISGVEEKACQPLVQYLARYGLRFGMMDTEMALRVHQEETLYQDTLKQDAKNYRDQANLNAVLAVVSRPWLPSEQREGRLIRGEDNCEGLQDTLAQRGYTVTGVGFEGNFLVRLSPDKDPYQ